MMGSVKRRWEGFRRLQLWHIKSQVEVVKPPVVKPTTTRFRCLKVMEVIIVKVMTPGTRFAVIHSSSAVLVFFRTTFLSF